MAPTETLNLVVAPDLAQDELPFLEHLGFRQAFTPLAPLHHIKRTKPPLDDARRRASRSASRIDEIKEDDGIASVASSRRASSSTAHSSGSSECAPASAKSRPSKTQGAPAQRTLSATELELQASRITNFISRMRYLTDEGNNQEFTPGVFPPGGSLAGRRSMIKAHAERVKNQLELKFQVIPYFFELDKYLDNASGARAAYNPLQIIRDRNIRPSERQSKHFQRQNIWQIPVSEMVQDMRWHYQSTKLRAQKMKRRQMKAGSISSGDADFHSASEAARENEHATDNEGSPAPAKIAPAEWQTPEQHGAPRAQHATPQFSNPFVSGNKRRQSQASEGPTLNLPETSCGELIQRMRSSHGAPEGSNSSSSGSRHSSFNESLEVDPLSQQSQQSQSQASQHQPSSFSRQFCRNTASVMDSKNRLRGSNASTDQVECSRLGDDDLLKPLSRVQTNNSQTLSMHSSRSSVPEIFNFEAASSSSLSLDQATHATQATPAQKGPVLTVTSDSGEQKLLDPLKRTPRATNLGTLRQPSPQKGGDAAHKGAPSMAISSDDSMNDPGNICTFGSIRPGHGDVRKAPWERAAHTAEEELEYHILLFKTALRRESLASVRERACRKNTSQDVCDRVSAELKNEGVPQFLGYLSGVEHNVVKQQQILDADFASSLDALRVTTDRMVSEVNTTLNKQVRELSSRMDKVTSARNCGICTNASYTLLEYVVLSLMWVIWSVVKLWRFLCGGFHMLRGGCSMFVIA